MRTVNTSRLTWLLHQFRSQWTGAHVAQTPSGLRASAPLTTLPKCPSTSAVPGHRSSLTPHHGAGRDTVSLAPFKTHTSFSLDTCPSLVHCGLEAKKIPPQRLKVPGGSSSWAPLPPLGQPRMGQLSAGSGS